MRHSASESYYFLYGSWDKRHMVMSWRTCVLTTLSLVTVACPNFAPTYYSYSWHGPGPGSIISCQFVKNNFLNQCSGLLFSDMDVSSMTDWSSWQWEDNIININWQTIQICLWPLYAPSPGCLCWAFSTYLTTDNE